MDQSCSLARMWVWSFQGHVKQLLLSERIAFPPTCMYLTRSWPFVYLMLDNLLKIRKTVDMDMLHMCLILLCKFAHKRVSILQSAHEDYWCIPVETSAGNLRSAIANVNSRHLCITPMMLSQAVCLMQDSFVVNADLIPTNISWVCWICGGGAFSVCTLGSEGAFVRQYVKFPKKHTVLSEMFHNTNGLSSWQQKLCLAKANMFGNDEMQLPSQQNKLFCSAVFDLNHISKLPFYCCIWIDVKMDDVIERSLQWRLVSTYQSIHLVSKAGRISDCEKMNELLNMMLGEYLHKKSWLMICDT